MPFRRANLPIIYTERIYQSKDLIQTIDIMLQETSIYKVLWFYQPELIELWKNRHTGDVAERIAKYIVRMATRTTINQLFGILMAEQIQKKEAYFLSTDFLRLYYTEKIMNRFDTSNIQYRLGNLIQKYHETYFINHYFEYSRKNLKIPQNTIMGKIIDVIEKKGIISGEILSREIGKLGVTKEKQKAAIRFLYEMGAIITNIDLESLAFQKDHAKRQKQAILEKEEIKKWESLIFKITFLESCNLEEFITSVKQINHDAGKLLKQPFSGRVLNGYMRETQSIPKRDFSMNRKVKGLFETLGKHTLEYRQMKEYEEEFIDKYGMFQTIPLIEAVSFYEQCRAGSRITEEEGLKKFFENKIKEANRDGREVIELTETEVDEIVSLHPGKKRTEEMQFDLRYRRYGKDVLISGIAFSFPGSFFCAYLEPEEMQFRMGSTKEAFLYYCPKYLSSIGCPRGIDRKEKIRIDIWEEGELGIEGLGVMADFDGLHLIDLKRRKFLLPINPTMKSFAFEIENTVMEFLDNLGRYLAGMPSALLPIDYLSWSDIPLIRYKNIVLQTRRWIIEGKYLTDARLQESLEKWKVSRYVFLLTETGEERYLDLDSSLARKWLVCYARNHKFVILEESCYEGEYFIDCFMTVKYKKEDEVICQGYYVEKPTRIPENSRAYSSWHLIYRQEREEEIKRVVWNYLEENHKYFFYIHYIEKGENVMRIRIKNDNFIKSRNFLQKLTENELIEEFSLQNYRPEIVRYGGVNYIGEFEKIFEEESLICFKMSACSTGKEKIFRQIATILSMLNNILGSKKNGEFLQLYFGGDRKAVLHHYKKNKKLFMENLPAAVEEMNKRFFLLDNRIKKLLTEIAKKEDTAYADYILLSLLHMRLNRMTGVSKEREELSLQLSAVLHKKLFMHRGEEK